MLHRPAPVLPALVMLLLTATAAMAAHYTVAPNEPGASDEGPGTEGKPFRTVAHALVRAGAGDTITLRPGAYPRITINLQYDKPLTLRGDGDASATLTGGLVIENAANVRLEHLKLTWPEERPTGYPTFVTVEESRGIEIAHCEIVDDPARSQWLGTAVKVNHSDAVTVRDCHVHHVWFGVSAYRSTNVTFARLDVGPWSHEDGIRVMECEGPVLVDACHITNTGVPGQKGGHVDALQVVYWTDNLTIRNCHIHGVMQAIGAFSCKDRRRRNWRIEGNLIYDVYTPHACTTVEVDGLTVVNNTFPQGRPVMANSTGVVFRNNICGRGGIDPAIVPDSDYNLWRWAEGTWKKSQQAVGPHDRSGVDPQFVNAPTWFFETSYEHRRDGTRTRVHLGQSVKGRLAVGDQVELHNTDGSARAGKLHRITAIEGDWITFEPPLAADPGPGGVLVYKWPAGHTDFTPDYRLREGSPAIDAGDGRVKRGADMLGQEPHDAPQAKNTGEGDPPYADQGCFEWVPAASAGRDGE